MLPNTLTDRELISFADKYIHTSGLPSDYQRELVKRFETLLNKIDDCELVDVELDNAEFLELRRQLEIFDIENEALQNEISELQEKLNSK